MVRKTLKAITAKISGLHEAAFWLAGFSVLSQILAFLRDRLLAYYFGAGQALDVYYTAFRIPDFIFVTVGSLVSISVLVPMFSKKSVPPNQQVQDKENGGVKSYIDSIFTSFSVLIITSCALAFVFMPQLVPFLFRGFEADSLVEIIKFSRILLLSPLLLGFSNFFGSIVQYEKRFLLYSLSPLFYNAGIIIGTAFGANNFGVIAVIFGVIFGAFLHFLVPVAYVIFSNNTPKFTSKINFAEMKETALISIPRALALSVTQIISIVFTAVASFFGVGAVAVFNLSFNLQSVPLSIIGASYSLAAFPTLSEHYAKNNIAECGKYIGESLRYIIFWTLPLSALFIILRAHIVRVVLGSGAFDWADTRLTAAVMALFALSFVFQNIQLFLTRAHYALGKTKVPLLLGLSGASITIILAYLLHFGFMESVMLWVEDFLEINTMIGSKIIILPISFSFGAMFTALGLWFSLDEKTRAIAKDGLFKTIYSVFAFSFIIGFVTFYALRIFDALFKLDSALNVFSHAFVSGLTGIVAGVVFLWIIGNREIKEIASKFSFKFPIKKS